MHNHKFTLTYILLFVTLSLILKMAGVIEISFFELFNYTVIIYGLNLVYTSFAKNKITLFLGSVLFLTGIVFFIVNNFYFSNAGEPILPSVLLITGLSCLMLYLSNRNDTIFLITGGLLVSAGIIIVMVIGHLSFDEYIATVIDVTINYWHILIILIVVVILLERIKKT